MSSNLDTNYSVLMSVYYKDKADWLTTALDSMVNQTVKPTEIVLVLDGPLTSELYQAIESFNASHPGCLNTVPLKKNGGLGPALQAGLSKCTTDIIARMDSDDYSFPERIEKQLSKMNQGFDMVGCNAVEFNEDIARPVSYRVLPEKEDEIIKFSKRRAPFLHPTLIAKKSALVAVGGWQNVPYAEDYDLFIRLLQANYVGYNIQEYLFAVRVDADLYRRRGGLSYAGNMIAFNTRQLKRGWFSPSQFIVRTAGNVLISIIPNSLRDFFYKKVLRKAAA